MKKETKISIAPANNFAGILTAVFVYLKLTGHIAWSWWWVASPLWAPLVLFIAIIALVGLVYAVGAIALSIMNGCTK